MSDASPFAWPALIDKSLIPDEAFAQAYAALSDIERSWIKKNIAQLCSLGPARAEEWSARTVSWRSGFQTIDNMRPRDWSILLLSGARASPARTVAALAPAATSGVFNLLCVFLGRFETSPHLLVSLELCGQEQACALVRRSFRPLLNTLARSLAKGLILDPDGLLQGLNLPDLPGIALWRPTPMRRLGIWSESPGQWDWQTLAWNHPDVSIEAWGASPPDRPQSRFRLMQGDWTAFRDHGYRYMGLPSRFLDRLPRSGADLVLTPGQEGCWRWPDLSADLFWSRQSILQPTGSPDREASIKA